jgi:hypothetical protein
MAKKKAKKSKPAVKKVSKKAAKVKKKVAKAVKKTVKNNKKATKNKIVLPVVVEEVEIVEIETESKPDAYKEHACEFVNEADCEEDLEEDGLDIEEVEKDHFDEEEDK